MRLFSSSKDYLSLFKVCPWYLCIYFDWHVETTLFGIIANTQLQPTHTLDLTTLNSGLGDVKGYFRVQGALDIEEIKSWDLDLSIELLLG